MKPINIKIDIYNNLYSSAKLKHNTYYRNLTNIVSKYEYCYVEYINKKNIKLYSIVNNEIVIDSCNLSWAPWNKQIDFRHINFWLDVVELSNKKKINEIKSLIENQIFK